MQGKYSIHGMRVTNTDAVSYQSKSPEKYLETNDQDNKKKYFHACIKNWRHFTPLVA